MRGLIQRLYYFMKGRYGNDQLNIFLLVLWGIIYILNLFLRNWGLRIIGLIPLGLCLYRALSKNITRRIYENNKFLPVYKKINSFITLQVKKIRDIKRLCYFKCPNCRAQLRVSRRKGVHTVRCPKCRHEFKKHILF